MHISRKVTSARSTCSQLVRVEKIVNLQNHNFCFEKHNYLLGLRPAPTTGATNLHKVVYVLCIFLKNVHIFANHVLRTFRWHRKRYTHQRQCMKSRKHNYPIPFKNVLLSFCPPSFAARACMRRSVAHPENMHKICTS